MSDVKGYIAGDWNAYCDYCEGQYLASQLKKDYWGFMACPKDFTKPNPQMFVRPKTEKIVVPWSRPVDGAQAYLIAPTPLANGSTTEIFVTGNGGISVEDGVNIYDYSVSNLQTATVNLHDPSFATLNIERQVTINNSPIDSTGATTGGRITITVQVPSVYVGNNTIQPGERAVIVMNKTKRSWTRIA